MQDIHIILNCFNALPESVKQKVNTPKIKAEAHKTNETKLKLTLKVNPINKTMSCIIKIILWTSIWYSENDKKKGFNFFKFIVFFK